MAVTDPAAFLQARNVRMRTKPSSFPMPEGGEAEVLVGRKPMAEADPAVFFQVRFVRMRTKTEFLSNA